MSFHDDVERGVAVVLAVFDTDTEAMCADAPRIGIDIDKLREARAADRLAVADEIRAKAYAMLAKMRGTGTFTAGPKTIN